MRANTNNFWWRPARRDCMRNWVGHHTRKSQKAWKTVYHEKNVKVGCSHQLWVVFLIFHGIRHRYAIYGNIFLLKYSGYFVWDLHTLLDRGNLCHSDVWYILCCLLRVFVSTVTWDFCTALLVPCTSKLVCLPFLQPFLFGFGICTFAVVIFCLFPEFLACPPFLQLVCGSTL